MEGSKEEEDRKTEMKEGKMGERNEGRKDGKKRGRRKGIIL